MTQKFIRSLALTSSVCIVLGAGSAGADDEHDAHVHGTIRVGEQSVTRASRLARITIVRAMEIAIARAPGRVVRSGLENEDGYLIYAVETEATDGGRTEVLVDASTGKILAVEDHESRKSKRRRE